MFEHFYEIAKQFLSSAGGASATIAMVLEFALRLYPSQKPLSILHLIGAGLHRLAAAGMKLAEIAGGAGDLLDKVLPQNIAGE